MIFRDSDIFNEKSVVQKQQDFTEIFLFSSISINQPLSQTTKAMFINTLKIRSWRFFRI